MRSETTHIDPVCRMTVKKVQADRSAQFDQMTYYFCTTKCKERFLADPAKYSTAEKPKPRGFWQRYLDRLKKSTDGKPPACCG